MSELFLSDQERQRREELSQLRELGIDPYPADLFEVNTQAAEIHEKFEEGSTEFESVTLAGRIINQQVMGKASFAKLQDSSGVVQLYVARDTICPGEDKTLYNTVFKKLISLGDFVGISGEVFLTKTGEKTVNVKELKILSKVLRPIPFQKETDEKLYETLTDTEQRYRMRYLDLIVHPEIRETFPETDETGAGDA